MKPYERNRRYRKVLTLRSQKKMTFREIADELGVSRARAHQIYQDALNDGRPVKRSRSRTMTPKQRRTRSIKRAIRT
jgi:DNA-directed RNA polymerase sigma subunit (sigma70/sigma32)